MENRKLTEEEKRQFIINKVIADIRHINRADLEETAEDLFDLKFNRTDYKHQVVDKLLEECQNKSDAYFIIYEKYKDQQFGINTGDINEVLHLSKHKRKQLEKYGLLKVAYTYKTRAYGQYLYVPIYTLESFFDLLGENIDKLLKEKRREIK